MQWYQTVSNASVEDRCMAFDSYKKVQQPPRSKALAALQHRHQVAYRGYLLYHRKTDQIPISYWRNCAEPQEAAGYFRMLPVV